MNLFMPLNTECDLPANSFITPFGNPCVYWDRMPDWDPDESCEECEMRDAEITARKRADMVPLLLNSTKYEDVWLKDCDSNRCAGLWETIDDVPDTILRFVEAASVNPMSDSLILETCAPMFNALIKQPCMHGLKLYGLDEYPRGMDLPSLS